MSTVVDAATLEVYYASTLTYACKTAVCRFTHRSTYAACEYRWHTNLHRLSPHSNPLCVHIIHTTWRHAMTPTSMHLLYISKVLPTDYVVRILLITPIKAAHFRAPQLQFIAQSLFAGNLRIPRGRHLSDFSLSLSGLCLFVFLPSRTRLSLYPSLSNGSLFLSAEKWH